MSGNVTVVDPSNSTAAGVNSRNQLNVAATSEPQEVVEALNGGAFIITTGSVNLTSANLSMLIYIKNTEDISWVLNGISGTFGATNGTGDSTAQFTINPTAGTLISAGTDLNPANLNFGSSKSLGGVFKLGGEAFTITNGLAAAPALVPEGVSVRAFPARPVIIAPGSGLAVGITPPTGNTSMNIQIQLPIHREIA